MTFKLMDNCRREMAQLAVPESVATLDYIEDFFHNGLNWTRDTYKAENGARCLVGAANYVRVSQIDCAKHWLLQAIQERAPQLKTIEAFNDDSRRSYEEVAAVIARAKQLAQQAQLPAPRPVAALPAPANDKRLPAVRASSGSVPAVRDVTPPPQRFGRYRPGLAAGAAAISFGVLAALFEE
jgi:hypothetical protein